MIIKFHIIVEAVFSLRIVCLCVSVCFSTLQSLFLCGNTSTGRCSLSCLDSSRLLSSLFFFFVCGLSVPRRLWTPLHTDGRFLPLSLAQLKMQSQGCCLTLLVRASLWFYTAYISQWSGYELQCCGVFVSIMRKNQKALLPEGEKHEGRHPGCLVFFFKFNYISKNCLMFYSVVITQWLLWWPRAYVFLRRCQNKISRLDLSQKHANMHYFFHPWVMFAVFPWEVKNRVKENNKLQQHYSIHPIVFGS